MFDDLDGDREAVVAELRRRMGALGGSTGGIRRIDDDPDSVLTAPGPLARLLPGGGLARGTVVGVGSSESGGAFSLLLALMAAPAGIWCAAVGLPELGLAAAAELGVDLDRLGVVPNPGRDLAQVLSVLADGMDVIAVACPAELPPARRRIITGRLKESGTVLLVLGPWPGADITLTVARMRWTGVGRGYGRLRDRELDIRVGGRRARSGAMVTLALTANRDAVIATEPARGRHQSTQNPPREIARGA